MLIDLVLPYPPTVNTYWRRRGSTYFISEEGKRYRRAVALIVRQQRLKLSLSGRLAIPEHGHCGAAGGCGAVRRPADDGELPYPRSHHPGAVKL